MMRLYNSLNAKGILWKSILTAITLTPFAYSAAPLPALSQVIEPVGCIVEDPCPSFSGSPNADETRFRFILNTSVEGVKQNSSTFLFPKAIQQARYICIEQAFNCPEAGLTIPFKPSNLIASRIKSVDDFADLEPKINFDRFKFDDFSGDPEGLIGGTRYDSTLLSEGSKFSLRLAFLVPPTSPDPLNDLSFLTLFLQARTSSSTFPIAVSLLNQTSFNTFFDPNFNFVSKPTLEVPEASSVVGLLSSVFFYTAVLMHQRIRGFIKKSHPSLKEQV
ncbi:hypothetical protein H6F90_11720 [Trichocoleus sp. FACHB-591]|uniref:hypothetical protein n=1 Tax=Trichocoleus sp. FACHB-591 TaxID=2692872 RepID=UPI001688F7CB|nr:hypothetical protein [Trichocoleus sp. FACHB-591]MBD2095816.1 hypothetical protein [Trichocoleus sp. FACHB-591]